MNKEIRKVVGKKGGKSFLQKAWDLHQFIKSLNKSLQRESNIKPIRRIIGRARAS